ncbi:MAG: DUF427 domain-containing protein [Streptosporangiaceae bacterium]
MERGDVAVRVEVGGVTVAETASPWLLREGGLPVRYYLDPQDVRMELLAPTDTESVCPFKGQASYWSVRLGETVHDDVAWSYEAPIPDVKEIKGLIAFYPEKASIIVGP